MSVVHFLHLFNKLQRLNLNIHPIIIYSVRTILKLLDLLNGGYWKKDIWAGCDSIEIRNIIITFYQKYIVNRKLFATPTTSKTINITTSETLASNSSRTDVIKRKISRKNLNRNWNLTIFRIFDRIGIWFVYMIYALVVTRELKAEQYIINFSLINFTKI